MPVPPLRPSNAPRTPSPKLAQLRIEAYDLVQKRDLDSAIGKYQAARQLALSENEAELAIHFLNNIAGCLQLSFSFREAMSVNRTALNEAKQNKFPKWESVISLNMASLLLEMGELKAAGEIFRSRSLDSNDLPEDTRLPALLLQINVFTKLKDTAEARRAFARAVAEAEVQPTTAMITANRKNYERWPESLRELKRAWVYSTFSQALTKLSQYSEAEAYALEAFRLRTIFQDRRRLRDALELAIISRHSQDYDGALRLISVSRQLDPAAMSPMHSFLLDREQARIALDRGNFSDAIPSLRLALQKSRAWRMEVLPSDSAFLNFESNLTGEVQAAFLDTILKTQFDLNQSGVAEESLWIAEEARFASMRAAQFPASEFSERLPKHYRTTLTAFQKAQDKAFSGDNSSQSEVAKLQHALTMIELEAGLTIPRSAANGTPGFQKWKESIPNDEILFSYYLSEPQSLAWTVTPSGVTVRRIAGRAQLIKWIDEFRAEIMSPSRNGISSASLELSRQLFGDYLYSHRTTPFWTMVLDQDLSKLPIAALPASSAGRNYLVEEHTLRALPSAIFLKFEPAKPWNYSSIGIADPVYNTADKRLKHSESIASNSSQLGRLPASAKEVEDSLEILSSRGWSTEIKSGLDAHADFLRKILHRSPDILHLSAHFVSQSENAHLLSVALSPSPGSKLTSLFSSLDLNSVRTKTKLVVLSGCSTSSGEVVPSIGINGLSRAFLISGADSVLATQWPTLDTNGPIFSAFYLRLTQQAWSSRAAASALRAAQLQMISQRGWTANPAYWAAYLVLSKG